MSIFEHKNSLRTIEAQIVQKLKNSEARPKFTKKSVYSCEVFDGKLKQNYSWFACDVITLSVMFV